MKALFKLVLRGSLVGAIAMATATGCGDDKGDGDAEGGDSSTAGTNSTSGTNNSAGDTSTDGGTSNGTAGSTGQDGGTAGTAGTGDVGGEGGTTSEGGAGPTPFGGAPNEGGASYEGPPIAKFCNTLEFGPEGEEEPTTMRLEVGEGAEKVTFTATTGECVPADGAACTPIPTGTDVLVSLFDVEDDAVAIDFSPIDVLENQQWIFYSDLIISEDPEVPPQPIWNGGTLNAGFACEDIVFDDI